MMEHFLHMVSKIFHLLMLMVQLNVKLCDVDMVVVVGDGGLVRLIFLEWVKSSEMPSVQCIFQWVAFLYRSFFFKNKMEEWI